MLPVSPAATPAHTSRSRSRADTERQCGASTADPLEAHGAERERLAARAAQQHAGDARPAVVADGQRDLVAEREALPGAAVARRAELDAGRRRPALRGRAPGG